jgi:hypothetical protein
MTHEIWPQPLPAPRLKDIISAPDFAEREASYCYIHTEIPAPATVEGAASVIAITEADGLRDLVSILDVMRHTFKELGRGPDHRKELRTTDSLLHDLSFLGHREYHYASQQLARFILADLATSPSGELYIEAQPRKSSAQVLGHVMDIIGDINPDAPQAIVPFNGSRFHNPAFMDRVRASPITIIDDWIVSGEQIRDRLEQLRVDQDLMSITVMSAPNTMLDSGINGVPIRSAFYHRFSPTYLDTGQNERASVTGAHGSVDYGFRDIIDRLIGSYCELEVLDADNEPPRMMPLLASIETAYAPHPNEAVRMAKAPSEAWHEAVKKQKEVARTLLLFDDASPKTT